MRKLFCVFSALFLVLLTACSQYAEPDVFELMSSVVSGQDVQEMTDANEAEVEMIFDINLDSVEEYAVRYSGRGGYADMVVIFKLNDSDQAEKTAQILENYRSSRYDDFKGYAPIEAKKIEDGRVLTYGRYVLLIILPDMQSAMDAAESAFTA